MPARTACPASAERERGRRSNLPRTAPGSTRPPIETTRSHSCACRSPRDTFAAGRGSPALYIRSRFDGQGVVLRVVVGGPDCRLLLRKLRGSNRVDNSTRCLPLVHCLCMGKGVCFTCAAFLST